MLKIVALNEEGNDNVSDEEIELTKEAQEAIAETEYLRAIKLKCDGRPDCCLHILNSLLEVQVLNENNMSNKLSVIKYNCYKNIAMISEDMSHYETALQNYIQAILLDDCDVYTLHKFGQLALKLNALDLAEYAFDSCLVRNSMHWSAAEGLLKTLCRKNNITTAYKLAVKMFQQNPYSKVVLQVLKEISTVFNRNILLVDDNVDVDRLNGMFSKNETLTEFSMLFDSSKLEESGEENNVKNECDKLRLIKINKCDWISIGQFIQNMYISQFQNLNVEFQFEDIFLNESKSPKDKKLGIEEDPSKPCLADANQTDINNEQISESPLSENNKEVGLEQNGIEILNNNDDSDSNARSDSCETSKSKPRRRCSDLHFLEQWGWHKNRRYNRKKTDRDEIDTSLNGYLRKLFSKYLSNIFTSKWPFKDTTEESTVPTNCETCNTHFTEDTFQSRTSKEFDCFINKLKQKPIDLMYLVYNWLKYISRALNIRMPPTTKHLYLAIFKIYISHFDVASWNQLTKNTFETSFRICLLFLELDFGHSDIWRNIYNHLNFNLGNCYIMGKNYEDYMLRLTYLEYLFFNLDNQNTKCISCLERMLNMLSQPSQDMSELHFPNISNSCLKKSHLEDICNAFKRQMDIDEIPKLFEQEAWHSLSNIIINNAEATFDNYENELWLKDFGIQIKILLQSLWNQALYEECLIWSEKCFHYIVSHLLTENRSHRQKVLVELHNYVMSYIEALILNERLHETFHLNENGLSRLVQNIINILVSQLDGATEKTNNCGEELDHKRLWIVIHQLLLREENNNPSAIAAKVNDKEDVNDLIPNSFLLLFTAHEFLGKKQLCSKDNGTFLLYILDTVTVNIRAPLYDACRELLYEYIEQVTYCLFKYPQKKARSKHLEEHEAVQIKLLWPRAVQMFDLYRPEKLPEFNSYKLESISIDMEQFLLKILTIMPKELDPSQSINHVTQFIEGQVKSPPEEADAFKMPYKMSSIFYLLADFYFKNRDFSKAIKYYILDLTILPARFDSWAGMALSKASKIETKLNGLNSLDEGIWPECEEVLRCFECCINLNRFQTLIWIEYGSFTYTVHSYFSRYLKHDSENLSMEKFSHLEEKKNNMLTISFNCFSFASSLQNTNVCNSDENDTNDEKWLCQYMLGKISEKRKEEPNIYLNHYLKAANYLYENNATYPIKINHSNPTNLSVEALEIFYRTNAAIIKFLEHGKKVTRSNGNLFKRVLKHLSSSPFAYNKAKVDDNSLNMIRGTALHNFKAPKRNLLLDNMPSDQMKGCVQIMEHSDAQRRESQESSQTVSTATPSSILSSGKTSDSSSAESETETDGSSEHETNTLDTDPPIENKKIDAIYKSVIQNIEECVTRFPEHYKSMFRLIYHYMHAPPNLRSLEKCQHLLLGQYKTSLGNIINGLFYERKNNNIFYGIWRIPSSEIDRPGGFSAHLVKCVHILIQVLLKTNNHKLLIEIGLNLHKTPDVDKRYITDTERKELCELSITYTVQILRSLLQRNIENRNDKDLVRLLIDIYKIHKKFVKYINQKEVIFTQLLTEVYKFFIKDKVNYIPENVNYVDLAIKLCIQEIAAQRNADRSHVMDSINACDQSILPPLSSANTSVLQTHHIPGLSMYSKLNTPALEYTPPTIVSLDGLPIDAKSNNLGIIAYPETTAQIFNGFPLLKNDSPEFQNLFQTYYKKLMENEHLPASLYNIKMNGNKTDDAPPSIRNTEINVNKESYNSQKSMLVLSPNATTFGNMATVGPLNLIPEVQSPLTVSNVQSECQKLPNKVKKLTKKNTKNSQPYNRLIKAENCVNENQTASNFLDLLNTYTNLNRHTNMFENCSSVFQGNSAIKKENDMTLAQTMQVSNEFCNMQELQSVNLLNMHTTMTAANESINLISTKMNNPIQNVLIAGVINAATNHPKTLQEKLAEKQKAGQLNEKSNLPDNNMEVIVLD